MASAHALGEVGLEPEGRTICFETRSGRLRATRRADRVELELPADPITTDQSLPGLEAALFGQAVVRSGCSRSFAVAELESEAAVRAARPDRELLCTLPRKVVVITAPAEEAGVDYVVRCFGPSLGIDEDPVTGSAHCVLGPYWAERTGRDRLVAVQASARGGRLWVAVGDGTVGVAGRATTVLSGTVVSP